jgi:uncharacterized RDD family membrane protein YckC
MHIAFPNVHHGFEGCVRYLSVPSETSPGEDYTLAGSEVTHLEWVTQATLDLAPEWQEQGLRSLVWQRADVPGSWMGASLAFAYLLASIRCARPLILEKLADAGDIWCTGAIGYADDTSILKPVSATQFHDKLAGFFQQTADRLFFVPAANVAQPQFRLCQTHGVGVLTLTQFLATLPAALANGTWPTRTVVLVAPRELPALVGSCFRRTVQPQVLDYGSLGARLGAGAIDGVVGYSFTLVHAVSNQEVGMLALALGVISHWLYCAIMESSTSRATIGKLALRLEVTDLSGGRIDFGRATARYFGKALSVLALFVGVLRIGWDPRGQAWHDAMSRTIVIRRANAGLGIYSGFWRRIAASAIDWCLVLPVSGFSIGMWLTILGQGNAPGIDPLAFTFVFISFALYGAIMESSPSQATLGKMALRIKVTTQDGARATFGRSARRQFGKLLSVATLFIGAFMMVWTQQKQGLHDLLSGCFVVRTHV